MYALISPLFLLAVLALGLSVRPAAADYDACMTFCLDEHSFSYCHPICDGSASNAGTVGETGDTGSTESAVPLFTAEKCRTPGERDTAFTTWIWQTYDTSAVAYSSLDDEGYVFGFDFYLDGTDDNCTGSVTFDHACRVFETEKIECSPYED